MLFTSGHADVQLSDSPSYWITRDAVINYDPNVATAITQNVLMSSVRASLGRRVVPASIIGYHPTKLASAASLQPRGCRNGESFSDQSSFNSIQYLVSTGSRADGVLGNIWRSVFYELKM